MRNRYTPGLFAGIAVLSIGLRPPSPVLAGRGSLDPAPAIKAHTVESLPGFMHTDLFRDIAARQNPVVVAIATRAQVTAVPGAESLQWLFDRPLAEGRIERGMGSGVVIGREGEILTNNHVVAGADVIDVALIGAGTRTFRATVIGRDPLSDTALIKLQNPPADLAVATLGDSDALEPGDWVMAIGSPFGLGQSVTVGVVSHEGRPIQTDHGRWLKLIQTDASINPGNSGGPLINTSGEVVGLNTAILNEDGSIGIGFAVPINVIKTLLPELRAGKVVRGCIGVHVRSEPLTSDDARSLGLPGPDGALVIAVELESPAARTGVRAGDLIVEFAGMPLSAPDDFMARLSATPPGTQTTLAIIRDGERRWLPVTVAELAREPEQKAQPASAPAADFGLDLGDRTPSIAATLRLPPALEGALVYDVEPDGAADLAGVRLGDLVRRINRSTIRSAAEGNRVLQTIRADETAFLLIWREGNEALVELRP